MHMVKLADGVGIWIDAKNAAIFKRLLMPAPIEIEPPGIGVDLHGDAMRGAGGQNLLDINFVAGSAQ